MNKNINRIRWIATLWLIGMVPFVICGWAHVCMAGHMKHPPYALWQWANDLLWTFCLVSCFVLSWRTKAKSIRWIRYGSLACIALRIPLGGITFPLDLLLCLWPTVVSMLYLVRPYKMVAGPVTPPHPEAVVEFLQG